SSINITVQQFFARRHRRRRFRLRYLQGLSALYLNLRARRQFARRPRRAWVFPRPQNWFQELLNNNALDHWWKENFRVSRDTFEYICQLVGPALQRQNTRMRDAIPVPKRVGASLWRLATGECYRSCGLMVGLAKPTVVNLHDARMLRLTDVYWAAEDENILMEPTFDLGGTVVRPLIVGDTAYPNKTWLIRPFKDNGGLTRDQRNFNREVSKARIVSEHAFGMTKGRWR
ncbi:unnamed protein product, partial [Porites lobata]